MTLTKQALDHNIVLLLVLTLITLVSWVGFEVYRVYTQPNIPDVTKLLTPIQPNLDVKVLTILQERKP